MRRLKIVSGILLILPIIDFALAAPVQVQEKGRACVGVLHRPEDVMTVLGKRVVEDLEKAAEEYLNTWEKPADSSGTHASPGTPSNPDHGLTNIAQAPASAPNLVSSSPLAAVPVHGVEGGPGQAGSYDHLHGPPLTPASSEVGLDRGLTGAHTPQPGSNPTPLTDIPFDLDFRMKAPNEPPPSKLSLNWKNLVNLKDTLASQSSNQKLSTGLTANWKKLVNLKGPPKPASSQPSDQKPSTGLGFNWKKKLANLKNPPAQGPASSQPSDPKPLAGSTFNWKNLVNPKDPPPGPASSQSSSSNPLTTPSIKAGLMGFADSLIDKLSLLDPLPRPRPPPTPPPWRPSDPGPSSQAPPTDSVWQSWDPNSLTDVVRLGQQPAEPQLRINPPSLSGPQNSRPLSPASSILSSSEVHSEHQSDSSSLDHDPEAAAAYAMKGKGIAPIVDESDSDLDW